MVATQEGANMKRRILCILLAVMMVLTGMHAPAAEAQEGEAVSNANIYINSTNFPDANFRNWIINNLSPSSSSSGYYLTQEQAEAVTALGLKGQEIFDAKGIEKFPNLTRLILWDNHLTALDVTKNVELTYLDLDNNQIKKLDLSKNTKLQTLYTSGNQLAYLRLVNNTSLGSSISTQTVTGQTGYVVGENYYFDLTKVMPKSYAQYVTLSDTSHTLDVTNAVVKLSGQTNYFSYTFNTGNANIGSYNVNIYIDSYTALSKPKITTQPSSKTVDPGTTVSFKVAASGGSLKYQWQYRTSSSGTWTNSGYSSATKATLSFTAAAKNNGYQYRCVVKNLAGSVTSNTVTLTVKGKPTITAQPASKDVAINETATFTVKAAGVSMSYQWQYRTSSSGSWANSGFTGAKTATLSVPGKTKYSGYQYRCRVKNSYGTVYSNAATLTVGKPIIKQQPVTVTVSKGATAEFTVSVRGSGLTFQWYYRTSPSGAWNKVTTSNASTYQMVSSVLQVKASASTHGHEYRCVITNKYGKATSNTVMLLVKNGPTITTQPSAKTVYSGQTAKFSVAAAGSDRTYQWYYRTSSSDSWKASGYSSAKTANLSFTAQSKHNGYQYMCRIRNSYGTIYTKAVKLTVNPITITTQPKAVTVYSGETAKFTVKASGGNLKYQWQYRTSSSGSWTNSGYTTAKKATLSFTAKDSNNGYQYRCIVSNASDKATSSAAKLTVQPATCTYRALLIGEEAFNPICTRNRGDAEHMRTMLSTIKGPEGTSYTSTLKIDLGYSAVQSAIQSTFANTKNTDVSLFFIATHGNSDGDGELALTDGNFLDFGTLANWLNTYVKGKVIVIIESCGSGSAIYGNMAEAANADKLLVHQAIEAFAAVDEAEMANTGVGAMRQSKFYVLAASAHHQMSWGHEGGDAGNYFTDWLIEGIGSSGHMPADTNNNNIVTLNELYTYISQYDTVTFQGTYTQQVQVYPVNSSYKLFKR